MGGLQAVFIGKAEVEIQRVRVYMLFLPGGADEQYFHRFMDLPIDCAAHTYYNIDMPNLLQEYRGTQSLQVLTAIRGEALQSERGTSSLIRQLTREAKGGKNEQT